ncbi:MAG TPA: hypothetical protein PLQ19_11230 [Aeromicrobium sp.]|nr:hypothetical protein [Aeromicrobium sp.]
MNNQQSHGTAKTKNPVRPAYLVSGAAVALVLNVVAFWVADQAGATWEVGQPYALEVNAGDWATGLALGFMHVVTAGAWALSLLWNQEG